VIRLTQEQIIAMHGKIIEATGGEQGLRDKSLLESAINAPFLGFDGVEPYSSVVQKAVRLCVGLVMNHPFVDGNKRIGIHAMLVFLAVNGVELEYSQSELADMVLQIAAGEKHYDDLLQWTIAHQK